MSQLLIMMRTVMKTMYRNQASTSAISLLRNIMAFLKLDLTVDSSDAKVKL